MYAFRPPCADFLLHTSASELEPRLVEIIAKGICSGHPNQDRRRIGHRLETRFAFTQSFFNVLPFRDFFLCPFQVFNVEVGTAPATNSSVGFA